MLLFQRKDYVESFKLTRITDKVVFLHLFCFVAPLVSSSIFGSTPTVCVKYCGLHNQNINMIALFACLVGWLNYLLVEFFLNKAQSLKTCLGM